MLPEPLFPNLSLMNPSIVILKSYAIKEEKIHWWNNLVIQYMFQRRTSLVEESQSCNQQNAHMLFKLHVESKLP